MRDHAAIEELIALHALNALDPSDEHALASQRSDHGAGCAECLHLESAYGEVAGRLAFSLEPAEIREGFEDELVTRALGDAQEPRSSGDHARERRRFATPVRAVAGFVAAVLIVAAGIGGYLLAPRQDTVAEALAEKLEQPGTQAVQLSGSGPGTMKVVYGPGDSDVFLVGAGLEEPPSGKAYELWRFEGKTPVSTGCFAPQEDGDVLHEVSANLSASNAMAITVESEACPAAPTSQPVMSAPL
ncbi:MAG: anti-sigma factor domain-containing protein [Actinomycetota bacterium]